MQLRVIEGFSSSLIDTPAAKLHEHLGGPTLIHHPAPHGGNNKEALFVSVLLHGNETSGWDGLRQLLRNSPALPRDLLVFIGNVEAAAAGVRTLPEQPDYNRIWRDHDGVEAVFAGQLLEYLERCQLAAALDIHNNTGRNPSYAVLTSLTPRNRGLAYLLSDKAVYVEEPDTVLSRTLEAFCPSIAVEVGPVGDPASDARAQRLLQEYLALEELPEDPGPALQLYRSVARVHVGDGIRFDFADEFIEGSVLDDDLILTSGMEAVNFHAIDAGFPFAMTRAPLHTTLRVLDANHTDVTDDFLEESQGLVSLRQPVIPAMFTTDHAVVRQDCLCYFMIEMSV